MGENYELKPILFSIIIPVFNVEKYLHKCLNSIISQSYQNLEIICINDGSSDSSGKILEGYIQSDNRIKVITQENMGVSTARNKGLKNATGDYILFVDADDWIAPNTCEKINSAILENNKPDLIYFNYIANFKNISRRITLTKPEKNNLWTICYSNKLIKDNNILFPINLKIAEDHIFKFNVLHYAKNIIKIEDYFYFYNVAREDSATKNLEKNFKGNLKAYKQLQNLLFYKNATISEKIAITDNFAQLLWGSWSILPPKIGTQYEYQLEKFIENFEQFTYENYKNREGYKRIKNRKLMKFLKQIRDIFYEIMHRRIINAK